MSLPEYSLKNRKVVWFFLFILLAGGALGFVTLGKKEDSVFVIKSASLVCSYPGATPLEVEQLVTEPIEREVQSMRLVHKITSESYYGLSKILVELDPATRASEIPQLWDELRRKVLNIQPRLPAGASPVTVADDFGDVYGIYYGLSVDGGFTWAELRDWAQRIKTALVTVDGVQKVSLFGEQTPVVNVYVNLAALANFAIRPETIVATIGQQNTIVNSGEKQAGALQIQILEAGTYKGLDDISNQMLTAASGKQYRLGDIARVERGYATPQRNGFFVDGKPALALCIAMESSAIVPDVGRAVDARLAEAMQQLPAGFHTEKIFFQPDKVSEAISSFMWNLLESVVIVILVLIFTMGLRSGLIIGFGLVLTVAVSFPILLTCGTTLQRISLGAFIVAMGMLVDNAVVIMDGILIDKKRGLSPKVYLYRIGRNTALPLLGATVIAASTFLGIYLSPDSAGEYAGDLFLVLCVSLLASWVLALVQVPICAKSWLPAREKGEAGAQKPAVMNSPVHRFVRRAIAFLIGYKRATIVVAFAVLGLSIFGMTRVKNLFFPDFDYKQFVVECFFPSATDADRVRDRLLEMSDSVRLHPGIERVAVSQGSAPAHYCLVRPMTSGGDCYGELIVDCPDYRTVLKTIPSIRRGLREAFPEAYIRIRKYNFSISTSHTVEVEFAGPDPAVLRELSAQAEAVMRRCPYVDAYSVENNWKPKGKALVAEFNQQDALRAGIGRGDVANALLAATDGMPVGVLNNQDRMVTLNLQVRNDDGSRIRNLDEIPVWSMMNFRLTDEELQGALTGGRGMSELQDRMFRAMPLGNAVRDIRLDWDEDVVLRMNGRRVIEAECDPDPECDEATPAKVVAAIRPEIEAIPLPEGYMMRWVGEGELQGEAIGNLMKYLPLTIFLILAILLLLFNSWRKVLLILLCFPFVFCGITPSLLLTGQPLTFMAIIGMMGLIGMMVKNAIVLVDEINRLQTEEHQPPYTAVVEATVSRVRPVLMASLTTIVGMIPLVGDPMYGSMALTIMGGLTVGTIITLILLPLFYAAMFRIRKPQNA